MMQTEYIAVRSQRRVLIEACGDDNSALMRSMKNTLNHAVFADKDLLTKSQRQVLTLYYFDSMSITKIAKKLRLNKSTVSRRMACAETRIKRVMEYARLGALNMEPEQ